MTKAAISLSDLNVKKKCEDGFRFEFLGEDSKGTGIFFIVIGAQAAPVQQWVNRQLNARRRQDALQSKKGRDVEVRSIEDDIDFGIEFISMRIVGWEGITEPWSPENALLLCNTNSLVVDQVRDASEQIENFTRRK